MTLKIDKDKYKEKDKDKDNDNDNDKDKDILRTPPKSHPRDLWPLRNLFRVMRRHDMTKKIDKDKYKEKDNDKNKDILRTWIPDNLCFPIINWHWTVFSILF